MSNTFIRLIKVAPDYISTHVKGNIATVTIKDCVKMSGTIRMYFIKNIALYV